MSSYETTCYDRKTGEECKVICIDDFYGRHMYGFSFLGGQEVIGKKEFDKLYTMEKPE